MARMRCGPPGPSLSVKLNLPAASALVLSATSMPLERLIRMTWSPAAGLLVVPLVTVPERVWAEAEAMVIVRIAAIRADLVRLVNITPWYQRSCELYKS